MIVRKPKPMPPEPPPLSAEEGRRIKMEEAAAERQGIERLRAEAAQRWSDERRSLTRNEA